jgi:hypothetical protein
MWQGTWSLNSNVDRGICRDVSTLWVGSLYQKEVPVTAIVCTRRGRDQPRSFGTLPLKRLHELGCQRIHKCNRRIHRDWRLTSYSSYKRTQGASAGLAAVISHREVCWESTCLQDRAMSPCDVNGKRYSIALWRHMTSDRLSPACA